MQMTQYKNCQNCGKPIEGGKFCSPECGNLYYKNPEGPKPLAVNHEKPEKNSKLDFQLEIKLTNTQWQRGLVWRQEKVETVAEARRRGIDEKTIFKYLKRSGLTDQTARKIMADARYCE
jgi:hypothetical protein